MGSVVIDDGFDLLLGWHVALDNIEEPDEFLVPMTLHGSPDHGAVENIESSEQRGSAMPDIVVCHPKEARSYYGQVEPDKQPPQLSFLAPPPVAFCINALRLPKVTTEYPVSTKVSHAGFVQRQAFRTLY